jgi:hypothetical protein
MAKRARRSGSGTFIQQSRAVSSEQKAIFHNIMGAGRRGVKRAFFDLNASDKQRAGEMLDRLVSEKLKQL